EAVAVQSHLAHARCLGAFRELLANSRRAGLVASTFDRILNRARRDNRLAGHVIHDLSVDVLQAAVHRQARLLGGTNKALAQALLATAATQLFEFVDLHNRYLLVSFTV